MRLIKSDDVVSLPRGRKATFDGELVKVLQSIKPGSFGVLDEEFEPTMDAAKRSAISGTIRKHWAKAHPGTKARVLWTPDGVPQVGQADKK